MPTVALQLSNVYPAGATVGAYHADTFPGSVPTIAATESATMDSAGVATFTTLTPGEEYVAYSSSNGRKVEFKVNKPEGRALISDAGDVDVSGITTGQVLQWQPSSQTWVPLSVVSGSGHRIVGTSLADVQAQAAATLTAGTTYGFDVIDADGNLIDFGAGVA